MLFLASTIISYPGDIFLFIARNASLNRLFILFLATALPVSFFTIIPGLLKL